MVGFLRRRQRWTPSPLLTSGPIPMAFEQFGGTVRHHARQRGERSVVAPLWEVYELSLWLREQEQERRLKARYPALLYPAPAPKDPQSSNRRVGGLNYL